MAITFEQSQIFEKIYYTERLQSQKHGKNGVNRYICNRSVESRRQNSALKQSNCWDCKHKDRNGE